MATTNKDFRVKHGLIVEGSTGTINNNNIVTDADTADVLAEGTTNFYYTDQKVKDVLTGSTQTNISITEVSGDLVITAENGVDDSTTDDLDEGATNLYYTDARVYDKVESILTAGTGIILTPDVYEDNIEISVDTETIATRAYVDAVAEGLHIHASVVVATDEPLADTISDTVTYNNETGTLTLGTALTALDSVTLTNGMRILVKDENGNLATNGIYTWATGGTILTRALDFNSAPEIASGDFTFVTSGTKYNNTGWVQTEPVSTMGDDAILWSQFSGAGTFTGGTGIDVNGQEISIDFTEFDTDDVTEGTANLYFTDERAVDALAEADIAVATIEINSIVKNVAFTTLVESTSAPEAVATFNKTAYRSAKYLVKMSTATHTQLSEVLVTLDSSDNIAMTEYAIVTSNGSLGDLTADISTNDVRLIADVANANTTVKVFGTLVE